MQIKKELRAIDQTIEIMEKEKRRNNIVVTGILLAIDDSNTLSQSMKKLMEEHLGIIVIINKTSKKEIRPALFNWKMKKKNLMC